jgi:YfiH family protein
MIRPDNIATAAFGTADDGDPRRDDDAMARFASELGIPPSWAWLRQVHGTEVVEATAAGEQGSADAVFTRVGGLPIAVATADCYPVVLAGPAAIGIAHAGWKGAAAGVVVALRRAMTESGSPPAFAAVGPGIGACCFEVQEDVASRFGGFEATTTWVTASVDLALVIGSQLQGLDVWYSGACTMSGVGFHSYRRDGTAERQVSVAWLPD